MATIQRSLLIDAPAHVSYAFWCDFERFPEFLEDVSRVEVAASGRMTWDRRNNDDTLPVEAHVVERIENRTIGWQFSSGPERSAMLTFARLDGGATWLTFALEYDPDETVGDVAGRLTALSRRLDRELRAAREMIEDRAREPLADRP